MLCADGARDGANVSAAVYSYNHSSSYVSQVVALSQSYGQTQAQTVAAATAGSVAVDWALAQVGTPYVWGGETPESPSTARVWFKQPTGWPAYPFPGWPRISTTPRPTSRRGIP
jgi:cell wall-associated NlpC family hydrolase